MGSHEPVEIDPKAAEHARMVWDGFAKLMKYSVIGTVIILSLMAIFLL